LCRLLTGFFSNKQEINLSLNLVGIDISDKIFNVAHIVIQKDDLHELTNYPTIKAHIMEFTKDKNVYVIDTGLECLSLIFNFDNSDINANKEEITSSIMEIQFYLDNFKVSILTGCGSFYKDITQIRNSYIEAVVAIKSRINISEDSISWYSELTLVPMYYYPLELEQRILISSRCGEYSSIEETLDLVFMENYIKSKISDNMSDLLVMKLKTTLLTASSELQTLDEALYKDTMVFILAPVENVPTSDIYRKIREQFKAICNITSMSQTIKRSQLKQSILEYIDNSFRDSDLSLSKVADTFNISETYLSSFFKEHTGINFLTYIESKRLTKACTLLKEHNDTIDTIAKTVGYSSAHSFRRAFKRNFGISPANYNK
ncbi:MAG: AraC family transcriptional regulator, partial [Herbinix sp.]|nr:AraC family transcriptional regulator [Herbinix sp.]